jgi:hypothetical protein
MDELDALLARELFRHDIVVDNAILTAKPEPLTLAKLKAAIESVQPPMLFVHPRDYAEVSARKKGFATVEEWLADGTGILHEIFTSSAVPEHTALYSKMPPRWQRHLEESERDLEDL